MPTLYVLIGLPGSGKSTWRGHFIDNPHHAVAISQDDLVDRYAEENGLNYTQAFAVAPLKDFEREVKRLFDEAVLAGEDIILDRTNLTPKSRGVFLRRAPGYKTIAITFEVPPDVLETRLQKRAEATGKTIPAHVVRMMRETYVPPIDGEFDAVITVTAAA